MEKITQAPPPPSIDPSSVIDLIVSLANEIIGVALAGQLTPFLIAFLASAASFLALRGKLTKFVHSANGWLGSNYLYIRPSHDLQQAAIYKDGNQLVVQTQISRFYIEDVKDVNILMLQMITTWDLLKSRIYNCTSWNKIVFIFLSTLFISIVFISLPQAWQSDWLYILVLMWPGVWPGVVLLYLEQRATNWQRLQIQASELSGSKDWNHVVELT